MRSSDIKVQVIESKDTSYSQTGLPDFKEAQPEIKVLGPKSPYSRPRTKASKNNSYT